MAKEALVPIIVCKLISSTTVALKKNKYIFLVILDLINASYCEKSLILIPCCHI